MITLLKYTLVLISIILSIATIYAVPATPYPVVISQPDGTELTIKVLGDEFFNYKTSEDGYMLLPNSKGVLHYATQNNEGKIVISTIKAYNVGKRSANEKKFISKLTPYINLNTLRQQKLAMRAASVNSNSLVQKVNPMKGSVKSLVILVNFKDKSFVTSTPNQAFTNLLNQDGYNANGGTGSARDYFMASSYGQFSPTFDVVGPVMLPQDIAFYGANNSSGDDANPQQMVIDACTAANATGVDFSQYDTDNNGILDNVFVYYAGYNEAEGASDNTVWPHRWSVYSGNIFDGKTLRDYACTSELKSTYGSNMCGIGTFCHEFGHVLGLVDYYHLDDSNKKTLETWDIMDAGAYNNFGRTPPTYSVYDRFFLGYLTPRQVQAGSDLTLKPLYQGKTPPANTDNQCFLFSATTHNLVGSSPSPKEFFLVEYRKKIGWDAYLPAEGMLIWHIDYDQAAWNDNSPNSYTGITQTASSHMRVYLQPLSGSTTSPGTAFTSGSFTPTTWAGVNINREITSIVKTADSINFIFMGGSRPIYVVPPTAIDASDISISSFIANWEKTFDASGYYLTVYNTSDGVSKLSEGFDKGLNAPIGWTIRANDTTNSSDFSGKAIPAIELKYTGQYIQTEKFLLPVNKLSFFIRSLNGLNGSVSVEAFNGVNWSKLDSILVNASLIDVTKEYTFKKEQNFNQFRLTYRLGSGFVALDDIAATFFENLDYNTKELWVSDTSYTVLNAVSNRDYFYKVRASDKTFNLDNSIKYENITDFSNTIKLRTLENMSKANALIATVDYTNGSVSIILPSTDVVVNVFNIMGQYIKSITPNNNKLVITGLPRHQTYILQAGSLRTKIIL